MTVIFSDDVRTEAGRMLERQIHARVPDVNVLYVDPRIAAPMSDQVMAARRAGQSGGGGYLCGSHRREGVEN